MLAVKIRDTWLTEFIKNSLVFQKCPKSTIAANHATNYSYKNCSFCIINYFEINSTVINTPKFLILVRVFVDDDGDNEMII